MKLSVTTLAVLAATAAYGASPRPIIAAGGGGGAWWLKGPPPSAAP